MKLRITVGKIMEALSGEKREYLKCGGTELAKICICRPGVDQTITYTSLCL